MPVTEEASTSELLERAATGGRLSFEEGMRLYQTATDAELHEAADRLRQRLHPDGVVTYLVDRNINYTNVCIIDCGFCAFYRKPASPEGYLLTNEQIGQKVKELQAWGGTRILLQGGVHPYLSSTTTLGCCATSEELTPASSATPSRRSRSGTSRAS